MSRETIWNRAQTGMLTDIVKALLAELPPSHVTTAQAALHETTAFVNAALRQAPWFVQIGERLARVVLWFWIRAIGRTPSQFAALLGAFTNAVRLYRSLVLLAYMESDAVLKKQNKETLKQRQAVFRILYNASKGSDL